MVFWMIKRWLFHHLTSKASFFGVLLFLNILFCSIEHRLTRGPLPIVCVSYCLCQVSQMVYKNPNVLYPAHAIFPHSIRVCVLSLC